MDKKKINILNKCSDEVISRDSLLPLANWHIIVHV